MPKRSACGSVLGPRRRRSCRVETRWPGGGAVICPPATDRALTGGRPMIAQQGKKAGKSNRRVSKTKQAGAAKRPASRRAVKKKKKGEAAGPAGEIPEGRHRSAPPAAVARRRWPRVWSSFRPSARPQAVPHSPLGVDQRQAQADRACAAGSGRRSRRSGTYPGVVPAPVLLGQLGRGPSTRPWCRIRYASRRNSVGDSSTGMPAAAHGPAMTRPAPGPRGAEDAAGVCGEPFHAAESAPQPPEHGPRTWRPGPPTENGLVT